AWLGPVNQTPDGSSVAPSAPTTLLATSPVAGRVDLSWTDTSANESRFEIAQDDTLVVRQSPGANVTTATFTGLNASTSYHFYVRACNAAGCSTWLGPVAKTPDGSDAAPTHVNVALAANGATAIASSTNSGSSGFGPSGAINGDRKGLSWGNGGGWND